ncbi:hypothetical protein ACJRO7_000138 [Eucalyptus globulus]|uniref:DUF4220 domain-containing protein n=1 Tax=Eucalyptus globulus TaxID=34317 RepID=A0ABD3LQ58_EUCGL
MEQMEHPSFVLLSLLLQIILILFAPLRKKTKNNHIVFLLWLAYLIADSVAIFGIGLISHNEGSSCAHVAEVDRALRAFWASFLLLHLGGPDTITAFSLEDSSLWRRHLLNLTFQVGAAIYVFVQIFPSDKSLVLPTMLIFLAGVIKKVERTLALNLSSLPRLRERVLSQDVALDDESIFDDEDIVAELDGYSHGEEEAKLPESIVVKHAYYFFQISKLFLTDLIFTYRQRYISRRYFRSVSAVDALRVISVELHFIYEVLHTKALTIRSKWSYVFRFIAFIDVVMAFVLKESRNASFTCSSRETTLGIFKLLFSLVF